MVKHEIFSPIYNILKKKNICGTKQQHDNENNVHRAIVKKIDTKKNYRKNSFSGRSCGRRY